jgi:hypothetical protein
VPVSSESESVNELPIQLRVCNVLRQWVDTQFFDFDKELLETLLAFIDSKLINHKSYKAFATSILNTINLVFPPLSFLWCTISRHIQKQTAGGMRVVTNDLRNDAKGVRLFIYLYFLFMDLFSNS